LCTVFGFSKTKFENHVAGNTESDDLILQNFRNIHLVSLFLEQEHDPVPGVRASEDFKRVENDPDPGD
jgi:hypothetical protein